MIDGRIYRNKESGKLLIKIGQNFKNHIFIYHVMSVDGICFTMPTIFKDEDLSMLEEVRLSKRELNKIYKSKEVLFSAFKALKNKYEDKN